MGFISAFNGRFASEADAKAVLDRYVAKREGVMLEDSIDVPATRITGKRSLAPKLQQQLEQLSRLPEAQQKLVMQVIEWMNSQATR